MGQGFYSAALVTTLIVVTSLYLLRVIENRFLYNLVGAPVTVRVRFTGPGFTPLTVLLTALEQVHVTVKEMAVEAGEDDNNTIRLLLRLPRGLSKSRLTGVIAELRDVQIVTII